MLTIKSICEAILTELSELFEHIGTILYREMLKRNTLQPMQKIIQEPNPESQRKLLRDWSQTKQNEASYIQLAGGLLFTTIASCLQWPGTTNGHWSASALFYASILLALLAIILGSQQMLVLPGISPRGVLDSEMQESEKRYLQDIVDRLCNTRRDDRPNHLQVVTLQAPFMVLSLAVAAFLAGLCSVVFAPLGRELVWGDEAKIAVLFGVVGFVSIVTFFVTSFMMHGLFSLQHDHGSRIGSFLANIRA